MNVERILQSLIDVNAEFLVIGGWSAILHGSSHITNDLDLFIPRDRANTQRLVDALAPYRPRPRGWPDSLPFVWDAATVLNASVLTLTTTQGDLDLLLEVKGLGTYQEVRAESVEMEAEGMRIWTIDLPSLIRAKRAAGRPKDLLTLPELESLLNATESD